MRCRYCHNLNLLTLPTCTHCGEELAPNEDPQPSWTAGETPRHERPRDPGVERWKSMALSVVVIAALGGGGFVTFDHWPTREPGYNPTPPQSEVIDSGAPTTPESGAPTTDPTAQVGDMGTLLQSVSASSDNLPSTLGSCSTVDSDIGPLRQLIEDRTAHVQQAQDLEADAIPDGESLKQALVSMLQATLDADQHYLTWAEEPDCTSVTSNSTIKEANDAATTAKRTFVDLWNDIAAQYGQPTYQWDDL
jgi:hypothetical protein